MVKIELDMSKEDYEDLIDEMDKYNVTYNGKFTDVGEYIIFLLDVLERDM